MPTTRRKVIKTVYKDEDDSEADAGDFSDSGSEAVISPPSSSEDDGEPEAHYSSDDDTKKSKKRKPNPGKNNKFTKTFLARVSQETSSDKCEHKSESKVKSTFSVKDLTDAEKLLPAILNLSESDSSSEDETPPNSTRQSSFMVNSQNEEDDIETSTEYKDVWSNNLKQSEEIAKKTFLELEKHKTKLDETKQTLQKYSVKNENTKESDVNDLLALGEDIVPVLKQPKAKKRKVTKAKNDSDSDMEDWEEVAEGKITSQQGLQLIVDFPGAACRKTKKLDVEMMMKRKINRVKKEYQVYMHKVHLLCWLGHGNYVSQVLNDQDILSKSLSLIPSQECYPGERSDIKYVEQITTWFKDKLTIKFDKNENKFRPKAPPLKQILLEQIQNRVVTSKKYVVYIFVSMLRAVGLQCRIMLNFTTLPLKPPSFELCSLSTKPKVDDGGKVKDNAKNKSLNKNIKKKCTGDKIPQLDGNYDSFSDNDFDNIMQIDGNNDETAIKDVSPPKRPRRHVVSKKVNSDTSNKSNTDDKSKISPFKADDKKESEVISKKVTRKLPSLRKNQTDKSNINQNPNKSDEVKLEDNAQKKLSRRLVGNSKNIEIPNTVSNDKIKRKKNADHPKIVVTNIDLDVANQSESKRHTRTQKRSHLSNQVQEKDEKKDQDIKKNSETSKYFDKMNPSKSKRDTRARKRSHTSNSNEHQENQLSNEIKNVRAKSVPGTTVNKSKYFEDKKIVDKITPEKKVTTSSRNTRAKEIKDDDTKRISHRDLEKKRVKPKIDVTGDLVNIIKKRVKEAKMDTKKAKASKSSDEDSDYLPEMIDQHQEVSTKKTNNKAGTCRKIDRRILSTDDEAPSNKVDVWCEIYVEELEQWVAVDVIKGKVHCVHEIYSGATHPVNYVVGWDNNNYLKDLTRRYVPQWNTVTRKQRVEVVWWQEAIQPWLGPKTPRDKEEDETLDRMQLDAPLPKSIAEYKNHPLYALKRHLLKFEAIYPPDASTLGFVRGEAVYARECVYVCRSRDTWLKEAKIVRLGEKPYKVVKARPKWDKLSNKVITDKPLEVFGPWQVQDYEPPTAENGIVPRNAYGNVELFKECMLPKGTVHIKLPGLNRVSKKLNIDCAPAMTGFDFNGGWTHPVFDGFVVCKEFEEIIINAWQEDQEEQERKELEKLEARVYGNWRRLIKGLLIRERLKLKYGFSEPTGSQDIKNRSKTPRLVVKKKCLDK